MSTYIEVKFKDISFNCVPNGATCDPYTGDLWGNYDIILRTALGTNYDTPINIQMQPDGSGVPVTPGLFRYAEIKYQNYTVETFPVVNWLSTAFAAGQSTLPNMALILDNAAVMDNSRVILWFSGGPGATDISKSLVFLKGSGEKNTSPVGVPYTIGIIAADSSGGLGNPQLASAIPSFTFSSELKTIAAPQAAQTLLADTKGQDFWRTTLNTKYFTFPYERSFAGLIQQTYFEDFTNGYLKQVDIKTLDPYKQKRIGMSATGSKLLIINTIKAQPADYDTVLVGYKSPVASAIINDDIDNDVSDYGTPQNYNTYDNNLYQFTYHFEMSSLDIDLATMNGGDTYRFIIFQYGVVPTPDPPPYNPDMTTLGGIASFQVNYGIVDKPSGTVLNVPPLSLKNSFTANNGYKYLVVDLTLSSDKTSVTANIVN